MEYQFNDVYKKHQSKIKQYIKSKLINRPADAEDVHSDVFLKVYNNLNKFNSRENKSETDLIKWIYFIAKNTVIDFVRNDNKKRFTSISNDDTHIINIVDTTNDIIKSIEDEKIMTTILNTLNRLDSNGRTNREFIFRKHFIEEMKLQEISDTYNININNVKTAIFTSRKLLQEMLTEQGITVKSYINK
jgi:RNA polymerase sigma factor (sigma-70 family)